MLVLVYLCIYDVDTRARGRRLFCCIGIDRNCSISSRSVLLLRDDTCTLNHVTTCTCRAVSGSPGGKLSISVHYIIRSPIAQALATHMLKKSQVTPARSCGCLVRGRTNINIPCTDGAASLALRVTDIPLPSHRPAGDRRAKEFTKPVTAHAHTRTK